QEAGRTATVLDIRPTRLRDSRHIEAVALRDERDLVRCEFVELTMALEVLPNPVSAHRRLRGTDAWSHSDIQESVGHGRAPLRRRSQRTGDAPERRQPLG